MSSFGWSGFAPSARAQTRFEAIYGLVFVGCGGSGSGSAKPQHSAQQPSVVTAAEGAVHDRVDTKLAESRSKYPDDAQVFPAGGSSCKPFSDYQLDCTQKVHDESNPWTGTTNWRATVNPKSGKVTVAEHGGPTLNSILDKRSVCVAGGAC